MTKVFHSQDIACGGCTASIEKNLAPMPGVKSVIGEPESKTVTVEFDESQMDVARLLKTLEDLGFESSVLN